MRRHLLSALAAALVVAAPSAAATATPRSGLFGVVTKSPLTPVCQVNKPCSGPAAKVVIVFLRSGRPAGRVTTDRAGKYRVALSPGLYTVRIAAGRRSSPATARVPARRFARVDFAIDTGIR